MTCNVCCARVAVCGVVCGKRRAVVSKYAGNLEFELYRVGNVKLSCCGSIGWLPAAQITLTILGPRAVPDSNSRLSALRQLGDVDLFATFDNHESVGRRQTRGFGTQAQFFAHRGAALTPKIDGGFEFSQC